MDYGKNLEYIQNYYANTLIVQYNGKNNATKTIQQLTNLEYVNMMPLQLQYAFDWKTAVGAQLDVIGKWVGVSRSYNLQGFVGRKLLAYPLSARLLADPMETSSLQHGYSDYDTYSETTDGGMLRYSDLQQLTSELGDDDYRTIIGLKIIYNNIEHTCGAIDKAIWEYFDNKVYTTWQPHTVIYHYPQDLSQLISICDYKGVLPAPVGVEVQTTLIS